MDLDATSEEEDPHAPIPRSPGPFALKDDHPGRIRRWLKRKRTESEATIVCHGSMSISFSTVQISHDPNSPPKLHQQGSGSREPSANLAVPNLHRQASVDSSVGIFERVPSIPEADEPLSPRP